MIPLAQFFCSLDTPRVVDGELIRLVALHDDDTGPKLGGAKLVCHALEDDALLDSAVVKAMLDQLFSGRVLAHVVLL
jgi:hypothetical protein